MPYSLSLQEYCKPEFYEPAPESWERRLREISPIEGGLSHLRFRKFAVRDDWYWKDRPIWAVYSCTQRKGVHPDRAAQFEKHWSELPKEKQAGRKALVSDYQHFMWETEGLYVQPFWLLQGEWGGTPALYTPRERRYLDASGALSEPFPIGFFPACPFDERAVKKIVQRDRLIQASNRYDELEKMDRPEALKAADNAAELLYRETYLDTLRVMAEPAAEFMKSWLGRSQANDVLPPAPAGLEHTLATWKEVWRETGIMPAVTPAPHKRVFATV
jgi:hypothetical protein